MRKPSEIIVNGKTLEKILEDHKHWLKEDIEGWENMRADLSDADLYGANLLYTKLLCADLTDANLSNADLSNANLSGADLTGADLTGADLRYANLLYTNLRGTNLSGADLSYANLSGANFNGANLSNADLYGANIRDCNLSNANLNDADLYGAIDYREVEKKMTLNEAIKHAEEVAEKFESLHERYENMDEDRLLFRVEENECKNCAKEHRQLAEWLKELKQLREQIKTGHWIDHSDEGYVECPICGSATNCDDNISDLHFCFSCGAKMDEELEAIT